MTIQIELESLRKETDISSKERRQQLEDSLKNLQGEAVRLTEIWDKERAELQSIKSAQGDLENARIELEAAQREGNFGRASELQYATIPSIQSRLPQEGSEDRVSGLIHDTVTADDIATVVSRITGIPLDKLSSGEVARLVHMEYVDLERFLPT